MLLTLHKQIQNLKSYIDQADQKAETVSQKQVGWHIEHSLIIINRTCQELQKEKSTNFKGNYKPVRLLVFLSKFIPRGKAKAPEAVTPKQNYSADELKEHIVSAEESLKQMEDLPTKSHFKHPYFGDINQRMSLKFLRIHTWHHIKIIRDIIKCTD